MPPESNEAPYAVDVLATGCWNTAIEREIGCHTTRWEVVWEEVEVEVEVEVAVEVEFLRLSV